MKFLARLRDGPWPVAAAALVGVLLCLSSAWRAVELRTFDTLSVLTAPGEVPLPITIIAIDEESMGEMKVQWPWPRGTHARLLEKLKEAGVALVAFDVVFAEPDRDPAQDAAFAKAIREMGAPVVLAANLEFRDTAYARQWVRIDPVKAFTQAGAVTGLASVVVDPDGFLRKVPTSQGALWLSTVMAFDKARPGIARNLSVSEQDRIRYLGGPKTFTTIPYHRLLDPEKLLSPNWKEVLADNIVFVGKVFDTATELSMVEADMFRTPFSHGTGKLTPGVETHATIVANKLMGETREEAPAGYAIGLVLLAGVGAGLAMRPWRPIVSGVAVVVLAGALVGADYALFQWQRLWVPGAAAVATLFLAYVAEGARSYVAELRRRQALRRAFATYVSPAVVDAIVADPESLKLGGDRRTLTVLFTDLAGFTSASEKLPAEKVADLLNRHLGEMADVVIAHGGTVDKFIGDAVMAFWGAPVADADQAKHALDAAIAMQAATKRLAAELTATGGPGLRMRVGVHRGECVVGNLGGARRFEYTAVGDAVNLASRLEGVNNVYGTGILVSDAVASAVPASGLRPVDSVRVKGRKQAVQLFTPCDDAALIDRTSGALAAYREGRWDDAVAEWNAIARDYPEDPVARVFLDRLGAWAQGWPREWDGVTELVSK